METSLCKDGDAYLTEYRAFGPKAHVTQQASLDALPLGPSQGYSVAGNALMMALVELAWTDTLARLLPPLLEFVR